MHVYIYIHIYTHMHVCMYVLNAIHEKRRSETIILSRFKKKSSLPTAVDDVSNFGLPNLFRGMPNEDTGYGK